MAKQDLIYPDLSYKIIGILFDVHNSLGGGLQEKVYYNAIKVAFEEVEIGCKEQVMVPLMYKGKKIGSYFLDFLIEDKIVLEIKTGDRFKRTNIEQTYAYLKSTGLKLGMLANFSKTGLKYKRIVNLY